MVLAACGSTGDRITDPAPLAPPDAETGHVHAVGVDPGEGSIYVAAHTGLFAAAPGEARASRIGRERRDVMGFTVEGPGRLAGSGHPDVRNGGPSSVGFIRSRDGGRTWQTVSLEGKADLHALEVAGRTVYGFDALNGLLRTSRDGGRTWSAREVPPVLDLAVDPGDRRRLVASTGGGLLRSVDGGRGLRPFSSIPPSHLVWRRDGIIALGLDGVVRQVEESGTARKLGRLSPAPAAAALHGESILAAMDDGSVLESRDGRQWRTLLRPTTG